MHGGGGGVAGMGTQPGTGLAWNWPGTPNARGGLLGWEFRMHEGVSSPGIPKGGGLKTLIY